MMRPASARPSREHRPASARTRPASARRESTPRDPGAIRFRCHYSNTIWDVLSTRDGWVDMPKATEDGRYTDSTDWDIAWADRAWAREYMHVHKLRESQALNHFRNSYELTRKDNVVKNLKRARKQLEKEGRHAEAARDWNFFPTTYVVPSEYGLFFEEFKRNPDSASLASLEIASTIVFHCLR